MNEHDRVNDLLSAYLLGELSQTQTERVQLHLNDCQLCADELERFESILHLTDKVKGLSAGDDDCESAQQILFNSISSESEKSERISKMKRYGRFAIAAGVMLAVILGINFIPGEKGGVVWADVLSQVQQVQNIMYRVSITMGGSYLEDMPKAAAAQVSEMEMTVIMSDEHGMKMETFMGGKITQLMYMLPSEKVMITVSPEAKKYMRIELDDEMVDKMQKESRDPRYMASQFMESEYVALGRDVIDGIEVEGIAVTDPEVFGGMFEKVHLEFWADVATGWPVQMKMDVTMPLGEKTMEMQMVMYDYQIGIEIDPAEFVPDIGDDYTALPSMQMPKMDGNSAIEGLKKFIEIAGRYPKKLNMMNMMAEIGEVKKEEMKQERKACKQAQENITEEEQREQERKAPKQAQENMPEEVIFTADIATREAEQDKVRDEIINEIINETMNETMDEMMKEMMSIMSVGQFYMRLVQEKRDPMYYGENVSPGDSDLILLRWRLDDGKYRVIFGDLDQKDVSAEQLAEWENVTE